jgi:hypothetical protein
MCTVGEEKYAHDDRAEVPDAPGPVQQRGGRGGPGPRAVRAHPVRLRQPQAAAAGAAERRRRGLERSLLKNRTLYNIVVVVVVVGVGVEVVVGMSAYMVVCYWLR